VEEPMGTDAWSLLLAAGAAVAIGSGAALQQQAAHGVTGHGSRGIGLIVVLLHRPLWLLGVAVMVAGYGLQAAALGLGRLAVVEPILATSLVVALVVAALRHRAWPRGADWVALALATGGVATFLIAAAPTGGRLVPPAVWWAPLLSGVAVLGLAVLWRSPTWPASRAAMGLAAVAGITLGCSDALVKTTLGSASELHWTVLATYAPYLLVIVGAAGFFLQQHAYRIGELKAALPAASVLEPVTGTVLGLTLFGERIATHDVWSGLTLGVAAAALIAGVWRLGAAPLLAGGSKIPVGVGSSANG
ncbi:MAG: DMT family transporter, partial [Candidatus Dormiibacterota bacterium]